MMDYHLLKKCRGSCKKGRDVSETNCIGFNPEHPDCRYRIFNNYNHGFCPYYIPTQNEKNYHKEIRDIVGVRYMRQPFSMVWAPILLALLTSLVYTVINMDIAPFLFALQGYIPYYIFCFCISLLGNRLYAKYGKDPLIAVLNKEGIYTQRLLLKWENIQKVSVSYEFYHGHVAVLKILMKSNGGFADYQECVYIYFSTLKMRYAIRKALSKYKSASII